MQSVLSRIWTHVAVSISYDDNHYTTGLREQYNMWIKGKWIIPEQGVVPSPTAR